MINKYINIAIAIIIISFIIQLVCFVHNTPWSDDFALIRFINTFDFNSGVYNNFNNIFSLHNEHRIVLVRLLGVLCIYLTGTLNFAYLCYLSILSFLALVFILSRDQKEPLMFLFAASVLLIPNIELNLWAMSSIQNVLVVLFTVLALTQLRTGISRPRLIKSLAFCVLATLSSSNGLLSFFILIPSIFVFRKEMKILDYFIFLLVSSLTISLYFYQFQSTTSDSNLSLLSFDSIVELGGHHLTLMGSFSKYWLPEDKYSIFIGIIFYIFLAFTLIKRRKHIDHWHIGLIGFILITTGVISLSRYNFSVGQALSYRYEIYPELLLVVLIDLYLINTHLSTYKKYWLIGMSMFYFIGSNIFSYDRLLSYHEKQVSTQHRFCIGDIREITFPNKKQGADRWSRLVDSGRYQCEYTDYKTKRLLTSNDKFTSSEGVLAAYDIQFETQIHVVISGWLVKLEESNIKDRMSIVLSDDNQDYIYATMSITRPDVTLAIHDGYDYSNSGFELIAKKADLNLKDGQYKVGVLIKSGGRLYYHTKGEYISIGSSSVFKEVKANHNNEESNIIGQWGVVKRGNPVIIDGWAFINNHLMENCISRVLLKRDSDIKALAFDIDSRVRNDVTKHFNDGNDYSHTGFRLKIIPSQLNVPSGKYRLGVEITCENNIETQFSGKFININ